MRRATAALALAVVGAYAGFASAAPIDHPMPSDWSFTLGAGALLTPSYPGAASTKVVPLPFVDVRYKDRIFLSPIAGLGVNVLAVPGARLGVSLLPDLGRSASQGNRLRGWGDISAGADVKLFGELRVLGPLAVLGLRDRHRELGQRALHAVLLWSRRGSIRGCPLARFAGSHLRGRRGAAGRVAGDARHRPHRPALVGKFHRPYRGPARRCSHQSAHRTPLPTDVRRVPRVPVLRGDPLRQRRAEGHHR